MPLATVTLICAFIAGVLALLSWLRDTDHWNND